MGPAIAGATETEALTPVTDGSGLEDVDNDRLVEHSANESQMWSAKADAVGEGLVFTFDRERMLYTIMIWNYNKPAYTDMGIQSADISVWSEKSGWKTALKGATLQEAEGTDDYDEPTLLTLKPVMAQKVRFENLRAFNPELKQIGLSEIRFFEPLGPAACNPEPTDGTAIQSTDKIALAWTAGKDAVAHDVYVGESDDALTLLGRVKGQPRIELSGLVPGKTYVWRIDEVDAAAAVETGALWSVVLRDPLTAHWKLDETEGTAASDAAGHDHHGTVVGQSGWDSSGQDGGAFVFDGASYVDAGNLRMEEPVEAISVAAWFKVDAFDKDCQAIVTKGDASWRLSRDGQTPYLHFACNGLDPWYLTGKTAVDDGRWHHAVAVYDGRAMLLYVDGQLDASQPVTGRLSQDAQPVRIGANSQQADRLWKGMIDDVRIYEYALNADQVQQLNRREPLVFSGGADGIRLVNADLVAPEESLAAIAAEQTVPDNSSQYRNLITVGIIILAVAGFAGLTVIRKKKTA